MESFTAGRVGDIRHGLPTLQILWFFSGFPVGGLERVPWGMVPALITIDMEEAGISIPKI